MQKVFKYILFVLISTVLMYFAFKDQNISEIISKLSTIEYKWLTISILFGALAFVSRGLRWVYLINALGYKVSKKNSINSVAVGYFTNALIPRAGEISRCTSLQQVEKIPFEKLFGTIILERVIDFAILIILILITLLYKFNEINFLFSKVFEESTGSYFTNPKKLFLISFILIIFIFSVIIDLKNRIKKLSLYKKFIKLIIGLKNGFSSIKELKNKTPFILHTILIWGMYILMTYICFFAIDETKNLNLFDGIYITIIGGLGMIVPTPGGFGSYHLFVEYGLVGIGIGIQSALLFAFVVHTAQTLMTLVFGIVSSLLLISHKKKSDE